MRGSRLAGPAEAENLINLRVGIFDAGFQEPLARAVHTLGEFRLAAGQGYFCSA